ncbi:MAG TPA: sigma-54-dependent Fis family transcriptional regulator, partial [Phycisphaerae bacterium]|nr:sigma-54-dependent Fis family transcriptional regulator [Phycisphaerae bacterium]
QVFRAAVGDRADQLIGQEYDQGLGISGKVLRAGRAMIVKDASREKSHYKDLDERLAFRTRSVISAPLIHKGRKLGVVEVLNPIHAHHFDDSDLQLSRIFANLAAIAAANAQSYERLQRENRGLKDTLRRGVEMIGTSPAIQAVRKLLERVARSKATVLMLGETGTGKELAARMIHLASRRAEAPFIAVNCAALPETLLESELFGHEAGAFTGAVGRKLGRFELAEGGTIFLDEIAEVAPGVQVKLLRVLQEKQIVRLGGTQTIGCDVRVIAATNRNLPEEMAAGRFREDLYYRLNVFPIEMPPLRGRREDIPLLAEHFVRQLAAEVKHAVPEISPQAMSALVQYDFPGNIRELQNLLERACLLCCCAEAEDDPRHGRILPEHLPPELQAHAPATGGGSVLQANEKAMIVNALRKSNWNQTRAAEALGISRDNIRYRIRKYRIKRPG